MKKLYQKTFEQALAQTYAPPERVEAQRSALASRCSPPKSEVTAMTAKPRRPIRILVTAAAVTAALTVGALAASGVLERVPFLTGGWMASGVHEDGTAWSSVAVSTDQESDPVSLRDGRVLFTAQGYVGQYGDRLVYADEEYYRLCDLTGEDLLRIPRLGV